MIVNIALLTVTDTRTLENDKSGSILVRKIEEAKHKLIDRKICKDEKEEIIKVLKDWLNNQKIDVTGPNEYTFRELINQTLLALKIKRLIIPLNNFVYIYMGDINTTGF